MGRLKIWNDDAGEWQYVVSPPPESPQTVTTVVDEVLFSDFTAAEGEAPSWPGVAPYRTIAADQVVLDCVILVVEAFNDSGAPSEIQVTDDPEGAGTQLCANTPNPASPPTRDAVTEISGTAFVLHKAGYTPTAGPLTPVVTLNGFADDGTTGRALIFTTIYTPPA